MFLLKNVSSMWTNLVLAYIFTSFPAAVCLSLPWDIWWSHQKAGDGDVPYVFQRLPDQCFPEGMSRGTQWATHEREDHIFPGEDTLCGPLGEVLCFITFPPWPSTHCGQDHVFLSHTPSPPIIYKAARHCMVCLGLGCRQSVSIWGTFKPWGTVTVNMTSVAISRQGHWNH